MNYQSITPLLPGLKDFIDFYENKSLRTVENLKTLWHKFEPDDTVSCRIDDLAKNILEKISEQFHELESFDSKINVKIARILAKNSPNKFVQNVKKFPIKDSKTLGELALLVAEHSPNDLAQYVDYFDIKDQDLLEKLAFIVVESSPKILARCIRHFNIKDQNTLKKLAFIVAERSPESLVKYVDYFCILDQEVLKKLAHMVIKNAIKVFPEYFKNFGFYDQKTLIEFAFLAAEGAPAEFSQYVEEFAILDQEVLGKLALIVAERSPEIFAWTIKNFCIKDQKILTKLANSVAKSCPEALACCITHFEIKSEEERIQLAKKIASVAPKAFLENIECFHIHLPRGRFEIAGLIGRKHPKILIENVQLLLNSAFSQPYHQLYLSQVWGLEGFGNVKFEEEITHRFSLEGWKKADTHYLVHMFLKSVKSFLRFLGKDHADQINPLLPILEDNPNHNLKRISEGKPCILLTGWRGHMVSYTFINDRIFLGNRGERLLDSPSGIEIIDLPKNGELKPLLELIESDDKDFDSFVKLFSGFSLTKKNPIFLKSQESGNCSFIGVKTAFYALLWETLTVWEAYIIYKKVTTYERMRSLMTYEPFEEDGMWKQIQEKLPSKINKFKIFFKIEITKDFGNDSFESFKEQLLLIKEELSPYFTKKDLFFGLTEEQDFINLAFLVAKKEPTFLADHLSNFCITNQSALNQIEKIIAEFRSEQTEEHPSKRVKSSVDPW